VLLYGAPKIPPNVPRERAVSKAWSDVDAYIAEHLMPADASLAGALAANEAAGLPAIDVSPPQG